MRENNLYIGKSITRIDARDKVTGAARYPDDHYYPNLLHMKARFAGRPHAIVRSMDTSQAEAMPGVVAVFTARDMVNNEFGWVTPDQPVLVGPGADPPGDRVHYPGDMLALVVAESEAIAAAGVNAIELDFEDLQPVQDMDEAIKEGAPLIHPERGSNVIAHYQMRKGDVESAFEQADVIVETTYRTPVQEHAYLQTEAAVGMIDEEGRVTVICADQGAHGVRAGLAHALGLEAEQVRIIHPAVGGGFGGRNVDAVTIGAALAAWKLEQRGIRRPVRFRWNREETTTYTQKRHPFRIHARWGATKDGKLVAAKVRLLADGGAYCMTSPLVLANTTLTCTGPYEIANIWVDADVVYTNTQVKCAFRGFGSPQGAIAAEGQMNQLAEKLGMDAVALRLRNTLRADSLLSTNSPPPAGVSISRVVEECAKAAGWENGHDGWRRKARSRVVELGKAHLRRGIGFACGYKNVGDGSGVKEVCSATIELDGGAEIESVLLGIAGVEMGQGSHTVFLQMAADALKVDINKIRLAGDDTSRSPDFGPSAASRSTFMGGNAILGAAGLALEKWRAEERPAAATFEYRAPQTTPFHPVTGESTPNFCYGYAAQAVEVEVDMETGMLRILKVISANDVGRAVNPRLIEGQVEGGAVMGAGYGVLENFIVEGSQTLTRNYATYLIPTVMDIPGEVVTVIVETPDPIGPFGARGVGEMALIPMAPAVAAAIHEATGAWLHEFPMTPERVLQHIMACHSKSSYI